MPRLVQPHPRVISFLEELEMTSQIARGVREEIKESVGVALEGVEIDLNTMSSSSSMDEGSLDDYYDDRLKCMSQLDLG